MTLAARAEVALHSLCRGARACGLDPSSVARLLLGTATLYARSAGWSLTRARAELGAQWTHESVAPGARASVPGGVVENPEQETDECTKA
jgi:hypothetical protein